MKAIISPVLGFCGSVLLLFMMPFSIVPGYVVMGIIFGCAGLVLLGLAYTLKLSARSLLTFLAVTAVLTFFMIGLTSRGVGFFQSRDGTDMDGITTVADAAAACRDSGLQGWDLVAYAQDLTARKFTYSTQNPWDTPVEAFKYGRGYCLQQALALKGIYDQLGVPCRVVYASRCQFEQKLADGSVVPEYVIGHAWLRVKIGGQELDVCSSDVDNRPGVLNFEILSRVRGMPPALRPLANMAFALENVWSGPRPG